MGLLCSRCWSPGLVAPGTAERRVLELATMLNTPVFGLEGLSVRVRVLQVYDGDTAWLAFCSPFIEARDVPRVFKTRVRFANYNSPEIRLRVDAPGRAAELEAGQAAKRMLETLLAPPACAEIMAVFGKTDKYGRPLVHLFTRAPGSRFFDTHVNAEMVRRGAGVPFMVGPTPSIPHPDQLSLL